MQLSSKQSIAGSSPAGPTTQKGAIMTYIVYVEDGFVCEDHEIPFDGDIKEMAREWFIEQLQRGEIEMLVEWE